MLFVTTSPSSHSTQTHRNGFNGARLTADRLRRDDLTVGRVARTVLAQHHVLAAASRRSCRLRCCCRRIADVLGQRRGSIDVLLQVCVRAQCEQRNSQTNTNHCKPVVATQHVFGCLTCCIACDDRHKQTCCEAVNDESYGPSMGVPESPELVEEMLSRRLNYSLTHNAHTYTHNWQVDGTNASRDADAGRT